MMRDDKNFELVGITKLNCFQQEIGNHKKPTITESVTQVEKAKI